MSDAEVPLVPIGTEKILGKVVPVYRVNGQAGRWCFQQDRWGKKYLVSVEAAKLFKKGPPPMDRGIAETIESCINPHGVPFLLQPPEVQRQCARDIIQVLLHRTDNAPPETP